MASMLEFRTPGFNPYAVKYSPYYDSRLAVAASANYGIVGNGRLFCLGLGAAGVQLEKSFDTNDALYDLAWSEINENQLVVACGDGSIKLFDMGVNDFPVMNFHEHKREAFSVCWNPISKDNFISSSWDGTVKLWSPTRNASLTTLPIGCCTYSTAFSPSNPALISAVSADSQIRLFDLRTPVSAKYHLVSIIPVHAPLSGPVLPRLASTPGGPPGATYAGAVPAEILTHDWNKYNTNIVAAAGVDRVIRTFDVRNPTGGPRSLLAGHEYAVRRLAWSPHANDILVSASYDMTVRVWTDGSTMLPAMGPGGQQMLDNTVRSGTQLGLMNRHTEFATGVDWCLFGTGGWVASVGWDERVLLWDAHTLLRG
ncbi:WD40-repeat-containing domain protein [Lasiosphaeris hirsuta]|uniref:Peroxin-7 n=1 Tax=Lasiosphaeris hirsuta TaxID=260670 RepID=A0AA40AH41_9PEZI|nr:WD40-repeat-containing domain protein [Lasiosphaeris hirsuta]